jgi:hypothetical protein
MKLRNERYRTMLSALRRNARAFHAAKPEEHTARLQSGIESLQAVVLFLLAEEDSSGEKLTAPLAAIEAAAYDAGRGANPDLFNHPTARDGKPDLLSREEVQGGLAYALDILRWAKTGRSLIADASWVAVEARLQGLRSEDGSIITQEQVKDWRAAIRRPVTAKGVAPSGARATFEMFRRMYTGRLNSIPKTDRKKGVETLVKIVVKAIATGSPFSGPKQKRR